MRWQPKYTYPHHQIRRVVLLETHTIRILFRLEGKGMRSLSFKAKYDDNIARVLLSQRSFQRKDC